MILIEYFTPTVSYGETINKMYVNTANIQFITYMAHGCSDNVVIGINGESFMLTKNSGDDLLSMMGLSKEGLIR